MSSKPLTYAMAVGLYGTQHVHNYMGMEPSGRYFNELCLDFNHKPHNPMINAGAIMTAALLKPELSAADRFDYVFHMYKRLAGGEYLGFNNGVFLSERECADRNFALAYFMRENKCFPPNTKLHETLDFYFQLCSLEITAEAGAVMAATLANGGINPLTGDPVLTVEAVRNTLTLMHSCGMYNYSGQFAFKVGLPSKSGVSGCVLLVVPNTMGICLWSPPLDSNGNSCRGVQFCMELVSRFTFHNFDNLRNHITTKTDPRMAKAESRAQILFDLLFSAAAGDLSALRRHSLSGTNMEAKDYDGRTALHVATSEGHLEIVEYLLKNCQVNPLPKDRWDRTPLDDARCFGYPRCGQLIMDMCKKKGIEIPPPVTEDSMKE
nr:glutaminase kidney isoform, mitochondrial-like [Penaeus vannamei]